MTFYVAPDADQSWEWITPGSIAGSILFLGATLLFRIYVHNFANYDKTYGPLGGVMVLLFWFWISSLILLGAAQVNKIIEEASPLGKNYGQRKNIAEAPDFAAMKPTPRILDSGSTRPKGLLDRSAVRRSGKAEASRVVSSETSAGLGSARLASVAAIGVDQRRVEPEGDRGPTHQVEPADIRSRPGDVDRARPVPLRPAGPGSRRPSPGRAGSDIRPRRRPGARPGDRPDGPVEERLAGRIARGRRAGSIERRSLARGPGRPARPQRLVRP